MAKEEFATREAAEEAIEQARAAFAEMNKPANMSEPEWMIFEAESMDAARAQLMPRPERPAQGPD